MNFRLMASTRLSSEDCDDRIPYSSKSAFDEEYNTYMAGLMGGTCYMKDSFETLLNQEPQKHIDRGNLVAGSGHHSCFGHSHVSIEITGVPKVFAMIINNEKEYYTSEKSGRYTVLKDVNDVENLYDKWLEILMKKIKEAYPNEPFMTDVKVKKLAQENARCLNSIFLPATNLIYTTSFRQLNYLCHWFEMEMDAPSNFIYSRLFDYFKGFVEFAKNEGLYKTSVANDNKGRGLSLVRPGFDNEIYDYAYQTTYKCSFPALADLQRHRSLDYFIDSKSLEDFISGECRRYFIPEIIKDDRKLVDEWLLDLAKKSVDDIPQGALITICESGNFETFMLRAKERICTCAQRDVMNVVRNKTIDYANALKKKGEETNSANYKKLYDKILPYTKGARCVAGYKCATPCGFREGITCTRKI